MLNWLKSLGRKRRAGTGAFARLDALDLPGFAPGTVWLVGAGPGAPGLISLLGYHALAKADVIVYDALVAKEMLALANPHAEQIYAGKRGGKPSPKQADISLRIVDLARRGKRVLRLKGGDPFVFGRGGEEAGALHKAGIPFRIVPGISSGLGGLAYAGVPVTHRETNHAVIFLTGHDETGTVPQSVDWQAIATATPVIVMFMAVKHLGSIAAKLIGAGRAPGDLVTIVSNAALPHQSVCETTLENATRPETLGDIPTPAIVVVGPVGHYREALDWYKGALRENPYG